MLMPMMVTRSVLEVCRVALVSCWCVTALLVLPPLVAAANPSFQDLVDATQENGLLKPPPGIYAGPVTIDFSITIEGGGQVTIDAGGKGSVIYIDSDGVTLKDLHLTNSGKSYNDIDSGVQVRGNFNVIKDCIIDNCLFGIDLQQSDHNILRRNRISSKDFDLGQRGDAVPRHQHVFSDDAHVAVADDDAVNAV
jgi:nitrous oxidase accessory protein